MSIGIGVISHLRSKHLEYFLESIKKYSLPDYKLSIYIDTPRRGVSFGKNTNLRELKDCDYVFLFDSDCFPIQKGWENYFINSSIECEQQHFQMLIESSSNRLLAIASDLDKKDFTAVNVFENTNGCMMFMTKKCIEKVGGYNIDFGLYGFEHADYSNRIHKAELTPLGKYTCPNEANKFIFALDLEAETELHRALKHKSSIEPIEAMINIKKAFTIYENSNQLFYPI